MIRKHKAGILWAAFASVALLGVLVRPGRFRSVTLQDSEPRSDAKVTFTRDIAPLVFKECASCHRPGGSGPFPLLNYEQVKSHGQQIVAVTQSRYMPPWLPDPGGEDFVGARRLSDAQIRLFQDWVDGGEIEGSPSELPPPPQFSGTWNLGPPDLVARIPEAYVLQAGGSDVFRNFVLPLHLQETKYVRALEVHPGDPRLVHHANVLIDTTHSWRELEGKDGQPGFPGILDQTEARSDFFNPPSHFLFWRPGTVPHSDPPEMSWRLTPDTDLVLNIHLQPSGRTEKIQPEVGLYFTSQPPTQHPMLVQLEDDGAIDIPADDSDFAVTDQLTLPLGVTLLAIGPHAHYLGKQVEAWATLPDGSRKELLHISRWDISWQGVYYYHQPVWLPKGTAVAMRITYDNSSANPRNPHNPPKRIRSGVRTSDEMGHVWLQVLPKEDPSGDPRLLLQEAVMRRRLEKYSDDFVAHCNLGELLVARKQYREAAAQLQVALRKDPNSATARSGLGAALLAEGRLDDAVHELKEALRVDPEHVNARLNLARALGAKGDLNGAAREIEKVLKQRPDDLDAHVGLGLVYFTQRRYAEALPHFQLAARLKPDDPDIQTNLGILLAMQGNLQAGIQAFQTALKLDPQDKTARAYLARAQALASKR